MNDNRTYLQDPKIQKAFKEAVESMHKNNKEFFDACREIKESYTTKNKDYVAIIKAAQEGNKETSAFMKWLLGASQQDKAVEALEYAKRKKEINDSDLSSSGKSAANFLHYSDSSKAQAKEDDKGFLGDTMEKTADEFSDEMQKIILGYKDFSEGMKSIGVEMSRYILKQLSDTLMKMIFTQQNAKGAVSGMKAVGSWGGGIWGTAINLIGGKFSKRHSGGVVPSGANMLLPGTEEQLALLKGGERILSPSESTGYNNQGGGSSPVVFNNFNIKAWDSKDVQKYLLENKQVINSITYEGIKNNNNQLRNMVRNA